MHSILEWKNGKTYQMYFFCSSEVGPKTSLKLWWWSEFGTPKCELHVFVICVCRWWFQHGRE